MQSWFDLEYLLILVAGEILLAILLGMALRHLGRDYEPPDEPKDGDTPRALMAAPVR